MFGTKHLAEILQAHAGASEAMTPCMYLQPGNQPIQTVEYLKVIREVYPLLSVNPFSHNRVAYSMWPIMLTLLNPPRHMRNCFNSMFLLGIIPGNGSKQPKNLDPYLEVVVDELLQLSGGATLYDAYQDAPFKLKAEILLYVLDYPGLGKVMKMAGSGAYNGCLWCEIQNLFTYMNFYHNTV